jgi:hypothetical protein
MSELVLKPGDIVTIDTESFEDIGKTYTIESIERYGISATGILVKFIEQDLPRILSEASLIKV